MKDAKGHGSDKRGAHAEGVQQLGQPKEYSWIKSPHTGGHILAHNGNYADQVGHVMPQAQRNGKTAYVGSYSYNNPSGGNAPSGYAHHNTVSSAKKYVESQLSKFWEPPKVRSGK